MKKTAELLTLISLIGLAGAYQENFTTSDTIDFLGNVFGAWSIDMLGNAVGFIPVILLFGLCVLGVVVLYTLIRVIVWITR